MISRRGLTLIELLISSAIAMALAGMAFTVFIQTRAAVYRAEARLAMHTSAQSIYAHLHRTFSGTMQNCAMVLSSTARTTSGSVTVPGNVSLIFMHGKESTEDWRWDELAKDGARYNSDMLWDMWLWKGTKGTLYSATNRRIRNFKITTGFIPHPSGPDYYWSDFRNLPQPRRVLDPTTPLRTLDDNVYFPNLPAAPTMSPADPTASAVPSRADIGDLGDFGDLRQQLSPAMNDIVSPTPATLSAFTIQLVAHDGTVTTVDDSAATTRVLNGAWLDGRLAPLVTDPQNFATSDAAKRPKLIRIRLVLSDTRKRLYQTFSFSFAMPGMAPAQPGAVP